jgi:hypothetical protein
MITLKVTPDEGTAYLVTATSRDVLTWEKTTTGKKSFMHLMSEPNLIDFYKLAHLASWRQGLFSGTFQEFEAQCEVAFEEEDEEPDPTQPAASAGPSSPSLSEPASPPQRGRKKANEQS